MTHSGEILFDPKGNDEKFGILGGKLNFPGLDMVDPSQFKPQKNDPGKNSHRFYLKGFKNDAKKQLQKLIN